MESENPKFGSIEELKQPLIGKKENLEPIGTSSKSCTIDRVPQVIRASTSKDFEMEKNKSISIDFVEERKELIIDVDENLEPQAQCCIYRVPRALRKKNEEAYTPKVISIGPLHHLEGEFADMEKQKIRYKREFCKRIGAEKCQQLMNFIEENEQRIRDSYEEKFKLEKLEFITMILYDAVFIIEFIWRLVRYPKDGNDFLINRTCLTNSIWLDLQLLENQLPFFVLDGLHKLAFPDHAPHLFILLSCMFFGQWKPPEKTPLKAEEIPVKAEDISHFTDLRRYFMTRRTREEYPKQGGHALRDLPCAAKLHRSGVQFNLNKVECLLDIKLVKENLLGISCLKVTKLQIPQIVVDDNTESLMRNLMAFEQCHYPQDTIVCNYVDLIDMLIDTDEDVNKLAEAGIISNNLGESARITKIFNDLCLGISLSESNYTGIIRALRDHYDNPWNSAKATLKRVYFSNLWKGTGTVAAFLLLLFNLIQAIWSIISAFA